MLGGKALIAGGAPSEVFDTGSACSVFGLPSWTATWDGTAAAAADAACSATADRRLASASSALAARRSAASRLTSASSLRRRSAQASRRSSARAWRSRLARRSSSKAAICPPRSSMRLFQAAAAACSAAARSWSALLCSTCLSDADTMLRRMSALNLPLSLKSLSTLGMSRARFGPSSQTIPSEVACTNLNSRLSSGATTSGCRATQASPFHSRAKPASGFHIPSAEVEPVMPNPSGGEVNCTCNRTWVLVSVTVVQDISPASAKPPPTSTLFLWSPLLHPRPAHSLSLSQTA
mmetsp:Transcript_136783/g.354770  ORF Transcript_136783/g.354770 Transcript_136783/m.354770 type:complete len:293 (+) Transcript_136783:1171-2049(+)